LSLRARARDRSRPRPATRFVTKTVAARVGYPRATQDLYEVVERGDYPERELCVQIMEDSEHPELAFGPLDDTKI
jgi:catalase